MHRFHLKQQNMQPDSFSILSAAAERLLTLRGVSLSAEDDAYTVTLTVDAEFEHDRYVITPKENGAALCAANDCALHAAFGRLLRLYADSVRQNDRLHPQKADPRHVFCDAFHELLPRGPPPEGL